MEKTLIRQVIFFGILGIVGILGLQAFLLYRNYDLNEKERDQQLRISLLNVAKQLADYNQSELPTLDLIKRITPNYYVVNINDVIDANVLEYYLYREMEDIQLPEDFEYAIYDCATDAMLYGNYCSIDDTEIHDTQTSDLPKYNDFIYYFGVRFPRKKSLLLNDPILPILMGGILLLTLLLFGNSLYVILKQKGLSERQRDFINNMTHEFRTPLASIQVAAEYFLKDKKVQDDERLTKYAQIISKQNNNLKEQVMNVLDLSKLEKNKFGITQRKINFVPILKEIFDLKTESEPDDITIDFDNRIGNHQILNLDIFHFRNVINNLLDNAIKYNEGDVLISIWIEDIGQQVEIGMSDNGIGVPEEDIPKLFDKYYRVYTGDIHNVKGFGLGLYYVRQVADAHQWNIRIDSELHVGTTFIIRIKK